MSGLVEPAIGSDDADVALRRLQAMLANISDTVTLVDEHGTILDTTGRYTGIMGYDPEDWIDRSILDLTHPDDVDRMLATRVAVLARPREEVTEEVRLLHSDGSWAHVELTAVNLLDDPAVGGIVITSRNVTHRKAIEDELATRRDDALEQARLRSELVARVSHELRNQLHGLRGLTELLDVAGLPRSTRHLVEATHRQSEQLQYLVDELLEYSRVDAGAKAREPEPTLVRQVVADAVELGRHLAPHLDVVGHTDESVPDSVLIDGPAIRQVLANLVSNAAKFTDSGRIEVDLSPSPIGGSPGLRWSVRDTGPGIADVDRARIFEPFEQGTAGSSRGTARGVGLGLAITRGVVESLDGSISLETAVGAGACFAVELPYVHHEAVEVGPGSDPAQSAVRDLAHVLVVEDNPVNQLLIREQLQRLGVSCTVVGDGHEALGLLADPSGISCVLMDWQLPGLDGVEVTRRHRAAEAGSRRTPIIGITASARPTDRAACLAAGMDELLVKPVGLAELQAALAPHVGERRSAPRKEDCGSADTKALDTLAEQLGSTSPVRAIVSTYLRELDVRHDAVTQALRDGDEELLRRTAHTLRSTSRTLGAVALDRLGGDLEETPFPPDPESVAAFDAAVDATRRRLLRWLELHP